MNIKQIVEELCKREGKKRQVNIAQMKEVVGYISEILAENQKALDSLVRLGNKRNKKKLGE